MIVVLLGIIVIFIFLAKDTIGVLQLFWSLEDTVSIKVVGSVLAYVFLLMGSLGVGTVLTDYIIQAGQRQCLFF